MPTTNATAVTFTSETIRAIAALWPLALIILIGAALIYWRKEFSELLRKFVRFVENLREMRAKIAGQEVALSQAANPTPATVEPPPEQKSAAEKPPETPLKPTASDEPKAPTDWFGEMFAAFFEGKAKEGDEAFSKLQQSQPDAVQKLKNEIFYLYLRHRYATDTGALSKIQTFTHNKEVATLAHHWLGMIYQHAGNFSRAVQEYDQEAAKATSPDDVVSATISASTCLFKSGEAAQSYKRIECELAKRPSPDLTARLYASLASLFELAKDDELKAFASEKAIEIRPNDTSLRFGAAYSYGEANFEPLSLTHYRTLLQYAPDHKSAMNNAGVAYSKLGMNLRSVDYYLKATEKNETLAMANLANKYIQAGFTKDASRLLEKARQQEDVHTAVATATKDLADKAETERRREEICQLTARAEQRFLSSFAEAYFVHSPTPALFGGVWKSADGFELKITQVGETAEALCILDHKSYNGAGAAHNRGLRLPLTEHVSASFLADLADRLRVYCYIDNLRLEVLIVPTDHDQYILKHCEKVS